jgi:hypothetical protein
LAWQKKGSPLFILASLLSEAGIDSSAYAQLAENGRIALRDLSVADRTKLADSMSIPLDTQDTFNGMERIYALRGPITKDRDLFKPLLWELARDFQKMASLTQNSLSQQLSTTPNSCV